MKTSPTQRTLKHLRDLGYDAEVVEKYNAFSRRRKDLFDCWDVAFVGLGCFGLCQTTSGSNVSARAKKIAENDTTGKLRDAGVKLVIHGWRKVKGRWQVREVDVSC